MTWQPGDPERRKMNQEDHDLLIEIRSDTKHMKEWTIAHESNDNQRHIDNLTKFDKIDNKVLWLQRLAWGIIGIVFFVELMNKLK